MKLLFVNTLSGFWGGVERYIYDTAELLSQHGFECHGYFKQAVLNHDSFIKVFTSWSLDNSKDRKKIFRELREAGIKIAFLHKIEDPFLMEDLQHNFKTILMVHDHDYYCLRHHKYYPINRKNCGYPYNLFYCSVCSGMISRVRGTRLGIKPINILRHYQMFCKTRKVDQFVVLSEYMKENLVKNKYPIERIHKIHPFRDLKGAIPEYPKSNKPIILYSGQIIRGKGLDLLIQALPLVQSDFELVVAGKGNDEGFIRNLVEDLKMERKVRFAGFVSDMDSLYRQASLVVVPSRWQEPFGLIGIEAFSRGRPVVGFDVGGIREWLQHEKNGLLVPLGDVAGLAKAITYVLKNQDWAKTAGELGFEYTKSHYSPNEFMKQWNSILRELNG